MKIFTVLSIFFFFQHEAHVSEVFIKKSDETLEQLAHRSTDIIEVKSNQKEFEVIKTVTFPKETHHSKLEATTFTESAAIYEVIKVIKGTESGKKTVKVWQRPDYDQGSYKLLHEKGISESPLIIRYGSTYPITGPGPRILLLIPSNLYPGIFELLGEESSGARKDIEKALKNPEKSESYNEPIQPIK